MVVFACSSIDIESYDHKFTHVDHKCFLSILNFMKGLIEGPMRPYTKNGKTPRVTGIVYQGCWDSSHHSSQFTDYRICKYS